jgi:hypothetical protein
MAGYLPVKVVDVWWMKDEEIKGKRRTKKKD